MWTDVAQGFSDGLHRFALAAVGFLPGVLLMLLVLSFSIAVAFLVRFALRKSLAGVDFDRRVHRWGLTSTGEWTPRNSPTALTAHAGFWFVLLVGFLASLQALGARITDAIARGTLDYLPNVVGSVAIFLVGIAVARFLERTVLISAVNMQIHSARLLSLGVKWLVVLFSTALTLQHLRVGGAILTVSFAIVFGGIVLGLALAVGLGSREAVTRSWQKSWDEGEKRATGTDEIRHM